jgi:hypothetical protein
MHGLNMTILLAAILNEPWLSVQNKIRLLEWTGRFLLALYASEHTPALHLEEIANYTPTTTALDGEKAWEDIISRAVSMEDDGHVVKMVRALGYGEKISKSLREKQPTTITGNMWKQLGSMSKFCLLILLAVLIFYILIRVWM